MEVKPFFFYLAVVNDGTSTEVTTNTVTSKPFTPQPVVMLQTDNYD